MSDQHTATTLPDVTDDEVEFYREHGWVVLRNVFPVDTITELRTWFVENVIDHHNPNITSRAFLYDRSPTERSELARRVAHSATLGEIACRLIGVPAVRHFFDNLLAKEPSAEGGTATKWHQDYPLQPLDRRGGLQFWIALDDLPAETGTMRFLEGSHRLGPLGRSLRWPEGVELRDVYPELADMDVSPELDLGPGDVTVHDSLTVHWAGANVSDKIRWAYSVSYMRADTRFNGLYNLATDGLGLELDGEFDHPAFPLYEAR